MLLEMLSIHVFTREPGIADFSDPVGADDVHAKLECEAVLFGARPIGDEMGDVFGEVALDPCTELTRILCQSRFRIAETGDGDNSAFERPSRGADEVGVEVGTLITSIVPELTEVCRIFSVIQEVATLAG